MRRLLVLLVLLSLGGEAAGDPPAAPAGPIEQPRTPEQAADAALAAFKAKDEPALKALAAQDDPDPWLVADELIARGEHGAALAFAKAAPRKDVERLPDFVAGRRGKPDDGAARKAVAAANAALTAADWTAALAAIDGSKAQPDGLLAVRLATGRGLALLRLQRLEEGVAAFQGAADAAENIGWWARESTALLQGGQGADGRSDFKTALALWLRRLTLEEARGDRSRIAYAVVAVGTAFESLGERTKSREYGERALRLMEEGGDRGGTGVALLNLGVSHANEGDWPGALDLYGRALKIEEELGDRANLAATLGNIASIHFQQADYAHARAEGERALAVYQEIGDRSGAALAMSSLAGTLGALAEYPKAISFAEKALALFEELGDRSRAAGTLADLGGFSDAIGDHAKALSYNTQALQRVEALGDRVRMAGILGTLANTYFHLGEVVQSLAQQERALKIAEEMGDRSMTAVLLGNVGFTRYSLGEYATALELFQRSLAISESLGDRAGEVYTLANIGDVHYTSGSYAKALDVEERALSLAETLGIRSQVARILENLGLVERAVGSHAKALEFLERASRTFEEIGDPGGVTLSLMNIGNVYYDLGDLPRSLAVMEQALSRGMKSSAGASTVQLANVGLLREALGDHAKAADLEERALARAVETGEREYEALALGYSGSIEAALGNSSKAMEYFERSLKAAEEIAADPILVQGLGALGSAALLAGDPRRALSLARRAVDLLGRIAGGLADGQGAAARGQLVDPYSIGVRAGVAAGNLAEVSFFLESGRAGTLAESLKARDSLRSAALPGDLLRLEALARAKQSAAVAAYRSGAGNADRARARELAGAVDAARVALAEVIERIQREAKRAASVIYPKADDLAAIEGRLGPREALLLYAFPDAKALALVVTAGAARVVDLGLTADIEEAIRALDLDSPGTEFAAPVAGLRRRILEALHLDPSISRLLVSPDGPLSYVPFALLAPDHEVVCVPSGTTYGLLAEDRARTGDGVLALGDPDYRLVRDRNALAASRGGWNLVALPGTGEEAKGVGDTILLGARASVPSLREALGARLRWHAVHLACHGIVDPERPTLSSLVLTPSGEDSGFLTALDVFRMKIPADLVVLSACETGKGKTIKGEGIVGFTRAFMFAGAPRVIVSLWKVDDEATRALMVKFYSLWNPKDGSKGMGTAAALKAAQAYVRSNEKWSHPYYWAAWVLWGLPD